MKELFVSILVMLVIFKFFEILIKSEHYKRIIKLLLACFFTLSISSFLFEFDMDLPISAFNINDDVNYENNIKKEFCNNLSEIITDDIHNKYYVDIGVTVDSNFDSLKIYIHNYGNSQKYIDIKNYIQNKYCTSNDEVILRNDI